MITSVGKFVARIRGNSCLVVLFSHQVEKKFHKQKTVFFVKYGYQHYGHEFSQIVVSSMSKTKTYH